LTLFTPAATKAAGSSFRVRAAMLKLPSGTIERSGPVAFPVSVQGLVPAHSFISLYRSISDRTIKAQPRSEMASLQKHLAKKMNHRLTVVLILGVTMCLSIAPAYSGPCSSEISQFESAVRQSAGNPNAGPTLPQSVGAQLGHQPTPGDMKRAEKQAERMFERALARAKTLDRRGDRAGCTRALADAKDMYILN
jgi:hypothetical protein